MKARTEIKRPGWQRAVDFDKTSLRREIMELKNENKKLADDLKAAREEIFFDRRNRYCIWRLRSKDRASLSKPKRIAGGKFKCKLAGFVYNDCHWNDGSINCWAFGREVNKGKILIWKKESRLDDKQFVKKMLNQYWALNLVYSYWNNDNRELYWGLINKGSKVRDDTILIRNN